MTGLPPPGAPPPRWLEHLERDGAVLVPGALSPAEVDRLREALDAPVPGALRRGAAVYGGRNLLREVAAVRDLARSPAARPLVERVLGPDARAVRALLFDKLVRANWGVGWHQDKCIAVAERVELPGFGPWSRKRGVVHVQPPAAVLQSMITLRVHLDDCGGENGALCVVPGSHRAGVLDDEQVIRRAERGPVRLMAAKAGDALLMRPLVLHASAPASTPRRRRVIHIEFAAAPLPAGLAWHDRV